MEPVCQRVEVTTHHQNLAETRNQRKTTVGGWCLLVELVAGQIHRGGLSFSLQTNTESPLNPTDLAPVFKTDAERLEQFLAYLATNQLIDSETWLERKLVYIPKLKELSDEYIVKLLRENGRDKVGTKSEHKKEKKKEKKNSTPVVEIPQALLSKPLFTDLGPPGNHTGER